MAITVLPRASSERVNAAPIPDAAPVTTATQRWEEEEWGTVMTESLLRMGRPQLATNAAASSIASAMRAGRCCPGRLLQPLHVYPWFFTQRNDMALAKKKRVGKRTISAKQVRKVASGRKRRKSDGTQPSKKVFPD